MPSIAPSAKTSAAIPVPAAIRRRFGRSTTSAIPSSAPASLRSAQWRNQIRLADRTAVLQIAEHYKAKVVDYGADSLILRVEGESDKLDAFLALLKGSKIVELVRSGKILMARGLETT